MLANNKTLQAYEEDAQGYVDKTPPGVVGVKRDWVEHTLSLLKPGAKILELGSGTGRYADYMEEKGFTVQRSEAARSFIKLMEQSGHQALFLDALTGDYGGPYDLILANAVLLHFTPAECETVFERTRRALAPGGLFAFSMKAGKGSEWNHDLKQPRFMKYWNAADLKKLVIKGGFEQVSLDEEFSQRSKLNWLLVIARKTVVQ